MGEQVALCVVCAWRKDCQKKFLKGHEVTLRCADFARDVAIKDGERDDGKTEDSGTRH
jgi:hypothetical protein